MNWIKVNEENQKAFDRVMVKINGLLYIKKVFGNHRRYVLDERDCTHYFTHYIPEAELLAALSFTEKLEEANKKLDAALDAETPESLMKFMDDKKHHPEDCPCPDCTSYYPNE